MSNVTKLEESAEIRPDAPKRKGRPPKPPMAYDGPMFGLSDTEVTDVPLAHLDIEDTTFQCRVTLKPELLVDSVKHHGIQVPLVVRKHPKKKDKYQIVCGFRRATAARQIGYVRIPVVIRDLKDEEAHILSYAENECRKTLSDLDRANGIAKLRATKKTTAQVAGLYRLSERQVQRLESLLEYPEDLKKAIDAQDSGVTTTHALVLMQATKKPGVRFDLREWISRIRKERMTVEALRGAVREAFAARRRSRRPWRWSGTKFTMSLRTVEKWTDGERQQAITEVSKLLAKLKG